MNDSIEMIIDDLKADYEKYVEDGTSDFRPADLRRYIERLSNLPKADACSLLGGVTALQEELAAFAHSQWSGWMEYLFSKCENITGNYDNKNREIVLTATIPSWACARWSKQMKTEYKELSEKEKDSDRKEAAAMIDIVCRYFA